MEKGKHDKSFFKRAARIFSLLLVVGFMFLPAVSLRAETGAKLKDKYTGYEGIPVEWKYGAGDGVVSYLETMEKLSGCANATQSISVDLSQIKDENGTLSVVQHEGRDAVFSDAASEYIEFDVTVPETAIYRLELDYYLDTVNSDGAKRALYVDGKYPFTEAGDIVFDRFFVDEGEPVLNSLGDETRPKQIAINSWRTAGLNDTSGILPEEFNLYLEKGTHTIRFVTLKTGMHISGIRVCQPKVARSYEEVKAEYQSLGYKPANAETINFQAELTAIEKNDPTLRRENDGDPFVVPASDINRKLNVMGGYRWRAGNQSITWEFEVPEDGLYKIGLYVKQQWNDGLPSYRQIAIDGDVPYKEFLDIYVERKQEVCRFLFPFVIPEEDFTSDIFKKREFSRFMYQFLKMFCNAKDVRNRLVHECATEEEVEKVTRELREILECMKEALGEKHSEKSMEKYCER